MSQLLQSAQVMLAMAAMVVAVAQPIMAQSLDHVPGVVVSHQPAPSSWDLLSKRATYTASPSIAVLPDGDYVVTHNVFGPGSGADVSGTTKVFRSSDKGATWTHITTLIDMKRGSLFVHDGSLYVWGYRNNSGDILIRRSDDSGSTWTTPTDDTNGLLRVGKFGGTPSNPVVFGGRIWVAQSGSRIMSASIDADLLQSTSWTLSNAANTGHGPLGSGLVLTEAQIVASPQTGVVIMPKVGGLPNTVLIRSGPSPATVVHPMADDWVDLPGGEKKFGAAYDPVSERFYVLSNPVLPAHTDAAKPELIRNTAAMLSSRDLKHWDVEQIFLYSSNIGYEAFQYLNFDFDGDDLIVASRTAFDVGGNKPPRGHDSNLVTFHRIGDFRQARPDHVLVLDTQNDRVLRLERTQHEPAPLGTFALGSTFFGAALTRPVGFGQDVHGDVYVQEQSGRILRFDALGNFMDVVETAPVALQREPLPIQQPPYGERTWILSGSGTWNDLTNWYYWNRPDTPYEVAKFGSAIHQNSTITVRERIVLKGMRFRSTHTYTIDGSGQLIVGADVGRALLDVQRGEHTVTLPVRLGSDVDASGSDAGDLHFSGGLDLNGYTMYITGDARFWVHGDFKMNGSKLVLDGKVPFGFGESAKARLDGALEFVEADDVTLNLGDTFTLIDGMQHVDAQFDALILPELPLGWRWDTSTLYVDGTVTVAAK